MRASFRVNESLLFALKAVVLFSWPYINQVVQQMNSDEVSHRRVHNFVFKQLESQIGVVL